MLMASVSVRAIFSSFACSTTRARPVGQLQVKWTQRRTTIMRFRCHVLPALLPALLAFVSSLHAGDRIQEPASAYGQYTKNNALPLAPGEHLMVDWRFITPGRATWSKPTGVDAGFSDQDAAAVRLERWRQPSGIRLEAQRAHKVG